MIKLSKNELKHIKGGFAMNGGPGTVVDFDANGSASCGSNPDVSITDCVGTITCTDGVGCKCKGKTATLIKCCPGVTSC